MKGTYKLTEDFTDTASRTVRDINLTPKDKRLPDIAVCRIYTNREDAKITLAALINA